MGALIFALLLIPALLGVLAVATRVLVGKVERTYPPAGQFLTVDGCRLHVRMAGHGPAVVLLHGTGASLEDYAGVFDDLAAHFRVIAPDRPGHGYSQRSAGDTGSPARQADLVHALVEKMGVSEAILVAHSWSGALALAYALKFPAATLGVVLLQGTVYPQSAGLSPALRLLNTPFLGPLFAHTLMPFAGRAAIRRALERAFSPEPAPPFYQQRATAMWTRPGQALAIARDARRRAETIGELSEHYAEMTRPLSLVVGSADTFIDPAGQLLRLAREIPAARLHVIPGAGHQIPQTCPQAVLEAVHELAASLGICEK